MGQSHNNVLILMFFNITTYSIHVHVHVVKNTYMYKNRTFANIAEEEPCRKSKSKSQGILKGNVVALTNFCPIKLLRHMLRMKGLFSWFMACKYGKVIKENTLLT